MISGVSMLFGGAPAPATVGTSLLHLNGANNSTVFTDVSGKAWTRNSGAVISTTQSKFGGASLYCRGGQLDAITSENSADFTFGTGAFTVEFWLYLSVVSGLQLLYDVRTPANETPVPTIYANGNSLLYYANGADRITGAVLTTGVWGHVAVCRDGSGITRLFYSGLQVGSNYTDANNYIGSRVMLGNHGPGSAVPLHNGYIDEFLSTKGVARYTANFTPPAAEHPNY